MSMKIDSPSFKKIKLKRVDRNFLVLVNTFFIVFLFSCSLFC